jgi:TPR repeat protein
MVEASKLRTRAEGGDANAQFALANTYWPEEGGNEVIHGDMGEAKKWLRKAAEQGHVQAQLRLAALVGEDDIEETLRWLGAAAEQGNPEAAMERCYYVIEFLSDEVEAIKWYRLARKAGHPHRGDALGIEAPAYRDFIWGKAYVPPKEKIPWERRLAKAGDPEAQYRLGALFANGSGVSLDFVQAYAWFVVAARPGVKQLMTSTLKQGKIPDWRTAARAVRLLEEVMEESEQELAKSLSKDYLNRFGGRVAVEAKLIRFAESCALLFLGIAVVLPVLMFRGIWGRLLPPKTQP